MDQETQQEGAPVNQAAPEVQQTQAAPTQQAPVVADASNEKLFAIIGYIIPILFFLPLVQDGLKNSEFARFHANQQAILLGLWVGVYVLSMVLFSIIYINIFFLMQLINLALIVLAIMGVINAAQGQKKELPLVGQFKIIK